MLSLTSRDCQSDFTFGALEQKKFKNNPAPTRCLECKSKKKDKFSGKMPSKNKKGKTPFDGICFAFKKGTCSKGDACRFKHVMEVPATQATVA